MTSLRQTTIPLAEDIEFDNSTNGFTSDNVQNAIEEAKFSSTIFNGIDAGVYLTSRVLTAYNGTGGQSVTASPSTIIIDTKTGASDNNAFNLSGGEVEFNFAGKYNIFFSIAFDNIDSTRTSSQTFLELNTGSGFSKVDSSDIFTYERITNADRQTGTGVVSLDVSIGDQIRIRSQVITGSNNTVVAEGCKIHIVPFNPETCKPNFTIDGSDLTQSEILSELDAGVI